MPKRALVIEDDEDIAGLVAIHLRDMDFTVETEHNGRIGYEKAIEKPFDLIVLDLMLPEMDGFSICSTLRKNNNNTPVMMLTARIEETDKIKGLEFGADIYSTKPFNVVEFKSMLMAFFRRIDIYRNETAPDKNQIIRAGNMVIHITNKSVSVGPARIDLTSKEFDLLLQLAANPGRSYSREELLSLVWGYDFQAYAHTVNTHINRLRSKIEPDINHPVFILTSWGTGYRFTDSLV
ncbi:MAG: response regulator transcription factor [Chitinophagaceae bacterium]